MSWKRSPVGAIFMEKGKKYVFIKYGYLGIELLITRLRYQENIKIILFIWGEIYRLVHAIQEYKVVWLIYTQGLPKALWLNQVWPLGRVSSRRIREFRGLRKHQFMIQND